MTSRPRAGDGETGRQPEESTLPVRLGFVGTGGIAKRHLAVAKGSAEMQVVAACDLDIERARQVAAEHGCGAFDDFRQMYDQARPDAVVVCVPPFAHGDVEVEAAERGIHLFVEKPVALDMQVAERVLAAIREAGVIAQVGYMYRLCRTIERVREILGERPIAMVQAYYFAGGMPNRAWWPKMSGSGGQLVEQATHMVDLGRYLVGEVATVSGLTATVRDWQPPAGWPGPDSWQVKYAEGFEIPDTAALLMRYETGAIGTLSCSMVPQASWTNGMTVVAEGARVHIAGPTPDISWETEEGTGEMPAEEDWSAHILVEFVRAVAAGGAVSGPYAAGVRTLAVSLAGDASAARGGEPVTVAEMLPAQLRG